MAEAIGLAASIIGLIQLTGKLVSLGYEYIGGGKDAPKDLRQLVDELHSLAKVLLILQDYARDDKTLQSTALQTLNGQNGPLQGCVLQLKRLQLKLEPKRGVRGEIKALVWPLKEKETNKCIEQIERHKSLFNLALAADQLTLSKSINGYVRDTSHIVRTLEGESLAQASWRQNEVGQGKCEGKIVSGLVDCAKGMYTATALHVAAREGDHSLVKLLLEKGADIEASDKEGSTVLHLAAWQRDCSLVKLLLEKGADIRASDREGSTVLHIAAWQKDRPLMKLLLEKGADIKASDHKGRNALHAVLRVAVAKVEVDRSLVKLLVEKGADIEAFDHKGKNALHLAARIRDRSLAELLLKKGANIEASDKLKSTALHVAARKGNLLVVQLLLNRDADISLSDISGWTALHLAAYMGHHLVVSLLLDWGFDTAAVDKSGQTALQMAVMKRHDSVIQLLSSEPPAAGSRTKRLAKYIEVSPPLSAKRAKPN